MNTDHEPDTARTKLSDLDFQMWLSRQPRVIAEFPLADLALRTQLLLSRGLSQSLVSINDRDAEVLHCAGVLDKDGRFNAAATRRLLLPRKVDPEQMKRWSRRDLVDSLADVSGGWREPEQPTIIASPSKVAKWLGYQDKRAMYRAANQGGIRLKRFSEMRYTTDETDVYNATGDKFLDECRGDTKS